MIGLRRRYWRRWGAALSGLALGVQLMLATAGLVIAAAAAPADALGPHALCLAGARDGDTGRPAQPADGAPGTPIHAHAALCCLWHQVPAVAPVAALPSQPAVYALVFVVEPRPASLVPGPGYGPHNARAPPTLA